MLLLYDESEIKDVCWLELIPSAFVGKSITDADVGEIEINGENVLVPDRAKL